MNNKRLAVVLTVTLILLTGCALNHSPLISKNGPLADKEHGVVVLSLGSESIKEPAIRLITSHPDGTPTDFEATTTAHFWNTGAWSAEQAVRPGPAGGRRVLLAYSVAPGDYAVNAVSLNIGGVAGFGGTVSLPQPYRFSVEAGKVTYLGVFDVNVPTTQNKWGVMVPALSRSMPSTMSLHLRNEFEEDNKLLLTLRPELSDAPVLRPYRP